jgi:hypothetical protein
MVREDSPNLNEAMELVDNLGGYVRRFQVVLVGGYFFWKRYFQATIKDTNHGRLQIQK